MSSTVSQKTTSTPSRVDNNPSKKRLTLVEKREQFEEQCRLLDEEKNRVDFRSPASFAAFSKKLQSIVNQEKSLIKLEKAAEKRNAEKLKKAEVKKAFDEAVKAYNAEYSSIESQIKTLRAKQVEIDRKREKTINQMKKAGYKPKKITRSQNPGPKRGWGAEEMNVLRAAIKSNPQIKPSLLKAKYNTAFPSAIRTPKAITNMCSKQKTIYKNRLLDISAKSVGQPNQTFSQLYKQWNM